ncbi:unnamed protein product [Nippostrongylus brasiliensis]|uniref:Recep_L_domain domain-containing protein n=1 Tax=Nippostrongylus brasiliensis TaxID=27835 RepID=A0A158R3Q4_NIPBR|nr:unnamed protein product [Nippostrongylus brasiliensis]
MIGCEVFYGNIVLQGGTLLPPREALKPFSVIGCIIVKKSQVENLDFLRNLQKVEKPDWACKNEIVDNPKLCLREEMEILLRSRIPELNMTLPEECEDVSDLQHLRSVRKIFGALRVKENPQLRKVDFLTGLEEIDARSSFGYAVEIVDNPVLIEVQLASLKRITSHESIVVLIENNPFLRGDITEWTEVAGGENRTQIVLASEEQDEDNG